MKIYIGADHNGFGLKAFLTEYLEKQNNIVFDKGDTQFDPNDDFPLYASQVVTAVLASDEEARGILICGSGQGMCMAANRFKGIRASLVWDIYEARAVRNDDDSNILCLPARVLTNKQAQAIVDTWMNTDFEPAPRFVRRLKQMDELG